MKEHLRQENLKHILDTIQYRTPRGKTVVKVELSPSYIRRLDAQISYNVRKLRDTPEDD